MKYEKTPVNKKVSDKAIDTAVKASLKDISTSKILWHVVRRHKFGLVATYAVALTLLNVYPTLPQILLSVIQ